MKRASRYAIELTVLPSVAVIILMLAAGARIYRWECYVWLACVAVFAVLAGSQWRSAPPAAPDLDPEDPEL